MSKVQESEVKLFPAQIPPAELDAYLAIIKKYRRQYIREASKIVDEVFAENNYGDRLLKTRDVSNIISEVRELGWQKFLAEESDFNTIVVRDLYKNVSTPNSILESLISTHLADKSGSGLENALKNLCGEYAGRIYPYIYVLSLSNTNSRRSRAGSTFEALIYKIYDLMGYPFDSQGKVGKKVFEEVGLGKKVDSVLPGIAAFKQRRNKTIIGTMKTSLRERWQEVAEEISRTNIPEIHLLTLDDDISKSKAQEMAAHNIVIVAPKDVAENQALGGMKNIISFEDYFYDEIPKCLEHWEK